MSRASQLLELLYLPPKELADDLEAIGLGKYTRKIIKYMDPFMLHKINLDVLLNRIGVSGDQRVRVREIVTKYFVPHTPRLSYARYKSFESVAARVSNVMDGSVIS